jgi:hypothetical protein
MCVCECHKKQKVEQNVFYQKSLFSASCLRATFLIVKMYLPPHTSSSSGVIWQLGFETDPQIWGRQYIL